VQVPVVLDATVAAHVGGSDAFEAGLIRVTGEAATLSEDPVDPTASVLSWR